jgi:hypothetical protein
VGEKILELGNERERERERERKAEYKRGTG